MLRTYQSTGDKVVFVRVLCSSRSAIFFFLTFLLYLSFGFCLMTPFVCWQLLKDLLLHGLCLPSTDCLAILLGFSYFVYDKCMQYYRFSSKHRVSCILQALTCIFFFFFFWIISKQLLYLIPFNLFHVLRISCKLIVRAKKLGSGSVQQHFLGGAVYSLLHHMLKLIRGSDDPLKSPREYIM